MNFGSMWNRHSLGVAAVLLLASLQLSSFDLDNLQWHVNTLEDQPFYGLAQGGTDGDYLSLNNNTTWWRRQIDVSNMTHPHLGAIHPNDKSLGWVVDPTVERLRTVHQQQHISGNSNIACPRNPDGTPALFGIEGEGGNKVLTKIQGGLDKARLQLSASSSSSPDHPPPKILCMIYAVSRGDATGHDNLAAIADTWGRRCDGFIAFSNLTDHTVGAIDFHHDGPESYGNMWQKVRAIWTYAYDHYHDEFDYFYIAGDDVYMAVDNLRVYLNGPEVKRLQDGYIDKISATYINRTMGTEKLRPRPLMFSTPMMWQRIPVIAGGAGYVLNQAALQVWGEKGADRYETERIDSKEDFLFGKFLADQGIFMSDTQDEKKGSRFGMAADFTYHFNGVRSPVRPLRLRAVFGYDIRAGIDHSSEQQISFHLKDDKPHLERLGQNNTIAELMMRYHALLYHKCDEAVVSGFARNVKQDAEQRK